MSTKVTQLSLIFPPIFTTSKPDRVDPFISSRKNVLSINLDQNQKHSRPIRPWDRFAVHPKQEQEDYTSESVRQELDAFKASQGPVHFGEHHEQPFPGSPLERNTLLIYRIRKIASEDADKQPDDRIDCIEIGPEPWNEHLRALDGLSPKHLRLDAGHLESIDVFELDRLNVKLKLESLIVSSVADNLTRTSNTNLNLSPEPTSSMGSDPTPSRPQYDRSFPEFFTHLRSLTLNYCCSIDFEGTNLPTHLQQLKIVGNNAMDMFTLAVDNLPNVGEQLEKVLIYTNPTSDMLLAFDLDDYRERLGRCKGLKELTLIIAGDNKGVEGPDSFDVGLSRSLPNGIESLEFQFSKSEPMLADLDLWIEAAKDPEWLPRLKNIRISTYEAKTDEFRLRNDEPKMAVDTEKDRMFLEKIGRVCEVLKSRSLSVEVGH